MTACLIDDRRANVESGASRAVASIVANGLKGTGHEGNERLIELVLLPWSRASRYLCRGAFSAHAFLVPRPLRSPTRPAIESDYPTRSWVHSIVTRRKILVGTHRPWALVGHESTAEIIRGIAARFTSDVTANLHENVGPWASSDRRNLQRATPLFLFLLLSVQIPKFMSPLAMYTNQRCGKWIHSPENVNLSLPTVSEDVLCAEHYLTDGSFDCQFSRIV